MDNYTSAKAKNQDMQKFLGDYVSEKTFERVCDCGAWLKFIADYGVKKHRLHAANFCKWPFCPMCNFRKARKDAQKISVCMAYINDVHQCEFIFLTLTAPNVKADKLPDEINNYNKAFVKLFDRRNVKPVVKGYIRKLEVTYNKKRDDYHPHFHVVIAVEKRYFKDTQYIKQRQWLEMWRECMDDDSITQVDVRKVSRRADAKTLAESFDSQEFAKYAAKHTDFLVDPDVFDAFYTALYKRQRLVYGGLFKTANKMYLDGELDHYKPTDKTVYYWEIMYSWQGKKYDEKARRPLDASDALFLGRKGIDTEVLEE